MNILLVSWTWAVGKKKPTYLKLKNTSNNKRQKREGKKEKRIKTDQEKLKQRKIGYDHTLNVLTTLFTKLRIAATVPNKRRASWTREINAAWAQHHAKRCSFSDYETRALHLWQWVYSKGILEIIQFELNTSQKQFASIDNLSFSKDLMQLHLTPIMQEGKTLKFAKLKQSDFLSLTLIEKKNSIKSYLKTANKRCEYREYEEMKEKKKTEIKK